VRFCHCFLTIIAVSLCLTWQTGAHAAPEPTPAVTGVESCVPGGTCMHPLPVRVVIVSMFEIGKDTGDTAGEFQLWRERRHLDVQIPFPQSYHDLFYNPDTQILGMVTGVGTARSAAATLALGLDQRFDVSHAYWLVAGIAGIDPAKASVGSAAWAHYLVDGDLAHEIDPREMPKDWKYGYFPRNRKGPNDARPPEASGEVFEINAGLRDWAFALTKDIKLPDDPSIVKERAKYTHYPQAQRPPFVLKGDQLAAMTFWHGKLMNNWAHDWVDYWTAGKGEFVTSAMEETGTYQSMIYLAKIGRADKNRVMVLRAGSNYTMQPPGETAAQHLLSENKGYAGLHAAVESLYLVGSKVIDTLLAHWEQYSKTIPQ
jgi:purine nucleoside permease